MKLGGRAPLALLVSVLSVACSGETGDDAAPEMLAVEVDGLPPMVDLDLELAQLPQRTEQNQAVCGRGNADPFIQDVCSSPIGQIDSLPALLESVGLGADRAFAMVGNSAALLGHEVSSILPRMIVFPRVDSDLKPPAELTIVQFSRGEQFVEVISRDLETQQLRFYVLRFEQACNYEEGGCDRAAKLLEEVEHNWTTFTLYEDTDLINTTFDCTSCHLSAGHDSPKILRMQELRAPWSHWFPQRFVSRTESDRVLMDQFLEAHAGIDEHFGGIPMSSIEGALEDGSAAQLEALIRAEGFGVQPNAYDPRIEAEYLEAGQSERWQEQFAASVRGESIPVPHPAIDATDPVKRLEAVESYKAVATGQAPRESLADMQHILSADAPVKMGLAPAEGLDGRAVIVQMCGRCHGDNADPAISRANFNVNQLDTMPRETKSLAVARMMGADTDYHLMPPKKAGWLSAAAKDAAIAELQK